MRVSVRKEDPGYVEDTVGNCTIFVNGIDVTNRCHTADEEEGKAWCFKHNEENKKIIDPDNDDKIAEEVLTGEVVIMLGREVNGCDAYSGH